MEIQNNPINNLLQFIGGLNIATEKFLPYNKGLAWSTYTKISQTNEIIKKLIQMRRANVGANGWDIHCNLFRSERRNKGYSDLVKKELKKLKIEKLISDKVNINSTYGNAYCVFNEDDRPIIQKPEYFNLYWDSINQKIRKVALLIDGRETTQFTDLVDIYHLKDPATDYKPLADSPIDSCYGWILLYDHAIQANNTLVSRGFIGGLLALFESDMSNQLDAKIEGKKNLTFGQTVLNKLKDAFGGTSNANQVAYISGVKEILELGKSNRDMQLPELLDKAKDAMFDAFGFERTGNQSTYNNASTFNYIQYDISGRHEEAQIEDLINNFILPHYGIETSEDLCFRFNPPNDPDELANKTFLLTAYQAMIGINTNPDYKEKVTNELRDKIGLDQLDSSLFSLPELPAPNPLQQVQPPSTDARFFQKGVERFSQSTPIEKALNSKDFINYITDEKGNRQEKGLLASFKKAIIKQLEKAISDLSKLDKLPKEVSLPKLETFYSFNTLKKDLLKFTEPAVEELKLIQKKETFDDFVYPEYLLEIVDQRTEALLHGTKTYAGIDAETGATINSILGNNLSKGVAEVVNILKARVKDLAESRAKLIATNEVASVVEQSREAVYKAQDYKFERFLNAEDKRVCIICTANENQGVVEIGSIECPAHVSCRCTKIYGVVAKDIE